MGSTSAETSPASERQLWSDLRNRAGKQRSEISVGGVAKSDVGKRLRDDSLLLLRGFDSVSASFSQLTGILDAASQGIRELSKPSLTYVLKEGILASKVYEQEEPKSKKQCHFNDDQEEAVVDDNKLKEQKDSGDNVKSEDCGNDSAPKDENMEKAKKLAVAMASKAASLARELKKMKSELCFMHDRCTLLEEENKRLREGCQESLGSDEDDLVRLQLESLLAEKSRLANENANLLRENQCLHQIVEYHQLTSQDLAESYDFAIQQGIRLDFSPFADQNATEEEGKGGEQKEVPSPPKTLCFDSKPVDQEIEKAEPLLST